MTRSVVIVRLSRSVALCRWPVLCVIRTTDREHTEQKAHNALSFAAGLLSICNQEREKEGDLPRITLSSAYREVRSMYNENAVNSKRERERYFNETLSALGVCFIVEARNSPI